MIPMEMSDQAGNRVLFKSEAHKYRVFLKLKSEGKRRELGEYYPASGTLYVRRVRAKHEHRISNAYGFNYELLSRLVGLRKVIILDDKGVWEAQSEDIIHYGEFLYFKEQGFERQIFYSINKLKAVRP